MFIIIIRNRSIEPYIRDFTHPQVMKPLTQVLTGKVPGKWRQLAAKNIYSPT